MRTPKFKYSEEQLAFFRKQGKIGGKLGSVARMVKLSPEQRSAIASKAAKASGVARQAKARAEESQ